jgi:hypothetical protein
MFVDDEEEGAAGAGPGPGAGAGAGAGVSSIPRRSFPNGAECAQTQGGERAYYHTQPQYFTFPSCTLTHAKPGANAIQGYFPTGSPDKHDIVFNNMPNLNMIVFEILIKLFDFAHDHIKNPDRIKETDALFDWYVDHIPGSDSALRIKAAEEAAAAKGKRKVQKGGDDTDASLDISTDEETESIPDVPGENMFTIKNKMKEVISDVLTEIISFTTPELIREVTKITKAEPMKGQTTDGNNNVYDNNVTLLLCFIIVTNNLFSSSTGFSTDNYLTNIYPNGLSKKADEQIIDNKIEIMNDEPMDVSIDDETNNGVTTDNQTIYDGSIDDENWLTLDDDELNEENISIKKMKLLIIKTLINAFDKKNQGLFDVTTQTILELFSEKKFDIFFEMYLQNYITNCKKPNIAPTYNEGAPMVGGQDNAVTRKLISLKNGIKDMALTRHLNDQIFKILVCNLLRSLGIITNQGAANNDLSAFQFTEFGNAIINPQYNATNYNQQNNREILLPNNAGSPVHPTLVILRYQLRKLQPVFTTYTQQGFSFNNYSSIEHIMDATMYEYSVSTGFRFDLNLGIDTSTIKCCPHAHIVSNASTTLGLGVPLQSDPGVPPLSHEIEQNADFKRDKLADDEEHRLFRSRTKIFGRDNCVIQTYAGILDPAGTSSIKFNAPYEYGDMDSFVIGKRFSGGRDERVQFNGIITLNTFDREKVSKQPDKIKYRLTNASVNSIRNVGEFSMDVRCNVNLNYAPCKNYDITKRNNNNGIQNSQEEIKQGVGMLEEPAVPVGPMLAHIRQNMLHTLIHDIVQMGLLVTPGYENLFENYYRLDVDRDPEEGEDLPVRGDHITRLFASTLNKTVGDLMQILTALTKYGGIVNLHAIHNKVIPYTNDTYAGHAYREIVHHDLTASVITYFMLIFGANEWTINNVSGAENNGPALGDAVQGPNSEDRQLILSARNPVWKNQHCFNEGINMAGGMSDHNNPRTGIGNQQFINNIIKQFNKNYMTDCNLISELSEIISQPYKNAVVYIPDETGRQSTLLVNYKSVLREHCSHFLINSAPLRKNLELSLNKLKDIKDVADWVQLAIQTLIFMAKSMKSCLLVFTLSDNEECHALDANSNCKQATNIMRDLAFRMMIMQQSVENSIFLDITDIIYAIRFMLQELIEIVRMADTVGDTAVKSRPADMGIAFLMFEEMASQVMVRPDNQTGYSEELPPGLISSCTNGRCVPQDLSERMGKTALRDNSGSSLGSSSGWSLGNVMGSEPIALSNERIAFTNIFKTVFNLSDDQINILYERYPRTFDNPTILNNLQTRLNGGDSLHEVSVWLFNNVLGFRVDGELVKEIWNGNILLDYLIDKYLRPQFGGRKTFRRRNKIAKFTIREKKHYARKSRKYYRKKHKTRSLNSV